MEKLLILGIIFITFVPSSLSKRILILPLQFPSIVSVHQALGNALIDLGHEVTMVLPPSLPNLEKFSKGRMKILTFEVTGYDFYKEAADNDLMSDMIGKPFTHIYRYMSDGLGFYCRDAIKDVKLMATLQESKFDLALVDSNVGVRLYYLIPHLLGIPYVSLNCERDMWAIRNTDLPSHVPFVLGSTYTNEMDFWQRLDNTYQMVEWALFPGLWYNEDSFVQTLVPGLPHSLDDLYRKSLLFFIDCEMVIDYPRATLPNEIILGGLTIKQPKPLASDLQQLVSQAEHGVIVMSFGSTLQDVKTEVFLEAFQKIPQIVIWRFIGKVPEFVPKNVKLMPWIPQLDLIAHNKTKLFITHCGSKGLEESVYFGVPMVGVPFSGDQMYNSKRMEHHGFGIALDIRTFTSYDLYAALFEVLSNPNYKDRTLKASNIMQDRPLLPTQKGAWWIEHVMKYGGNHLRPHSQDMPAYQVLMLDILALVLAIVLGMIVIFTFLGIFVLRHCRSSTKSKSE